MEVEQVFTGRGVDGGERLSVGGGDEFVVAKDSMAISAYEPETPNVEFYTHMKSPVGTSMVLPEGKERETGLDMV